MACPFTQLHGKWYRFIILGGGVQNIGGQVREDPSTIARWNKLW